MSSMFERVGEPRARTYRCAVHLLVERKGVPEALKPLALLCPGQGPDQAFWLRNRAVDGDRALLTATTLIDEHLIDTPSSPLRFVREQALDALRGLVPFLDDHLIWVDSRHDGLPPQAVHASGELKCGEPWARGPYMMQAVYEYPTRRGLGACALPSRTPIRGLFLCNEQVVPGLGFEGSFLASTSVARIIAGRYRKQEWLRRGPWANRGV